MWVFFFYLACSIFYLCLDWLQAVLFGVADVLSFPLPTRETRSPGELHLPLALFTLCKLSLSLTFGQTCSRTHFMACQVSLQSCNPFQRRRASFCRVFFSTFILSLLPKVLLEENIFSKKKPASLHYAPGICKAKKKCCRTSLNPTFQLASRCP